MIFIKCAVLTTTCLNTPLIPYTTYSLAHSLTCFESVIHSLISSLTITHAYSLTPLSRHYHHYQYHSLARSRSRPLDPPLTHLLRHSLALTSSLNHSPATTATKILTHLLAHSLTHSPVLLSTPLMHSVFRLLSNTH